MSTTSSPPVRRARRKGRTFKTTVDGQSGPQRPYTIARWTFIWRGWQVLYKDTRVDAPNDSHRASILRVSRSMGAAFLAISPAF
jgi:hypothetical protein